MKNKEKLYKKIIIIYKIGFFLMFILFLLFIFSDYQYYGKNYVGLNDKKVFMTQEDFNMLTDHYQKEEEKSPLEFAYCFDIGEKDNFYYIKNLQEAKINIQTSSEVDYSCPLNFLNLKKTGSLHSHPYNGEFCDITYMLKDIYNFGRSKEIIGGIICSNHTIVFFDRNMDFLRLEIE